MSEPISSVDLLRRTAYLASLAHRTALASNDPVAREQAIKLGPVARELKGLAQAAQPVQPSAAPARAASPEFQTLINAAAKKLEPASPALPQPALSNSAADRMAVALGMAQGGANAVEIAKSLGLTRGEVDLILNIAKQK